MKNILLTLSLFLVVLQPELRADEKPLHPLEGAWVGQEIVEGGEKIDLAAARAFKMVFQGAKVSVTTEAGKVTGTIQLDDSKNPKWMDIELAMDGAVRTIPAIYEVRDGIFRLCHPDGEGGKRPASLEASDDVVLATFRSQQVEQGGADQPASAPESKSEDEEKPKSESEGRSQ